MGRLSPARQRERKRVKRKDAHLRVGRDVGASGPRQLTDIVAVRPDI